VRKQAAQSNAILIRAPLLVKENTAHRNNPGNSRNIPLCRPTFPEVQQEEEYSPNFFGQLRRSFALEKYEHHLQKSLKH